MTVADRLAERDYVGPDALRFKSVKPGPDPPVAGLYLVGYADAAAAADGDVDLSQIAIGKEYLSADARAGFGDESRQAGAALAQLFDDLGHAPRVFPPGPSCLYGLMSIIVLVWPWYAASSAIMSRRPV